MAVDPKVVAEATLLVQVQAQARQQITDLTQATLVAEVRAFSAWYDHRAITALAGRLAKLTKAAQRQTAVSADSFAGRILRLVTGQRRSPSRPIDVSSGLRAVPLESVYGRLADQYRYLEATRGLSAPEALLARPSGPLVRLSEPEILDRVTTRVRLQVDDNLSLAFQQQMAADLAEAPTVTGYRRVIHPELSESGFSCALCVVASDRVYSTAELLPIHSRCACSVMPLVGDPGGDGDPGLTLNAADLRRLYGAAGGSTAGADLKKVRVAVEQHGELGPRLVLASDHFRTAAEAASADDVRPAV